MTEDYLVPGGRPLYYLNRVAEHYPLVMHGVSLSIGGSDPLDFDYLAKVKKLASDIQPAWVSDTYVGRVSTASICTISCHYRIQKRHYDMWLTVCVRYNIFLGRQILLENVSSYITFQYSRLEEWEFLTEVTKQADCLILLDVNNIYVSAFNHKFDPQDYLRGIPIDRVQQFHLAGHRAFPNHIIDTHDEPIIDGVWKLYADAVKRFGRVSTMIERDDNIPPLSELMAELAQAKTLQRRYMRNEVICGESKKRFRLLVGAIHRNVSACFGFT